jgi:hypothetical protein
LLGDFGFRLQAVEGEKRDTGLSEIQGGVGEVCTVALKAGFIAQLLPLLQLI